MSSFLDKQCGRLGYIKEELKIGEGQFTATYNYFKLRAKHISDQHKIGGTTWHLVLYPTGCQRCREPTLSIYLSSPEFPKHCVPGSRVKVWITLMNYKCPAKQETQSTLFTVGEGKKSEWGFDKFIPLTKLMNRREGWLGPDGQLALQVKLQIFANDSNPNKPKQSQQFPNEALNSEKIRYMESLILRNSGAQLTPKDIPMELTCPITMELMSDPVMLIESGQIYDRHAIQNWLQKYCTDPATNVQIVDKTLKPVYSIRSMCQQWKENLHQNSNTHSNSNSNLSLNLKGQQVSVLEQFGEVRRLGNVLQQLMSREELKVLKLVELLKSQEIDVGTQSEIQDQMEKSNQSLFESLVRLQNATKNLGSGQKLEDLGKMLREGISATL